MGKISHFLALNVNIWKAIIRPMLRLMINRKSHMSCRLTSRSMTLDDLELLQGHILSEFRLISRFWEATTAKRMKIDQ